MLKNRVLTVIFVILLFFCLTAVFTYPLILNMGNSVFGLDSLFYSWLFSHNTMSALAGFRDYTGGNIFYPSPDTVLFSDHLLGYLPITLPLCLILQNSVMAVNIVTMLSFVLSGLGMFLLVEHLTENRWAALISALIFAFNPYKSLHLPHLHLLSSQWLPFAFLFLHRSFKKPGWFNLFMIGFFMFLQFMVCGYLGVYAITFLTVAAGVFYLKERNTAVTAGIMGSAVLSGLLIFISFIPYIMLKNRIGFIEGGSAVFSPAFYSFFLTSEYNLAWGWLNRLFGSPLNAEALLFPGLACIILTGMGTAHLLKKHLPAPGDIPVNRPIIRFITVFLDILIILTLILNIAVFNRSFTGPKQFLAEVLKDQMLIPFWPMAVASLLIGLVLIRILADGAMRKRIILFFGAVDCNIAIYAVIAVAAFVLSFHHFYRMISFLPGYANLRVSSRIFFMTVFALSVLSGYSFKWLLEKIRPERLKTVFALLFCVLVFMEGLIIPVRTMQVPPMPEIYGAIPDKKSVILELPSLPALDTLYMNFSTKHRHSLINGYSGYSPAYYQALSEEVNRFPEGAGISLARELGAEYLVIHSQFYGDPEIITRISQWPGMNDQVELVAKSGTDYLYRIKGGKAPSENDGLAGLQVIDPKKCRGYSNLNFKTPGLTLDSDPKTDWSTVGPQKAGVLFAVDTGDMSKIAGIRLYQGKSASFFPLEYIIQASADGAEWRDVYRGRGVVPVREYFKNPLNPAFDIRFEPVSARFVRIVLASGKTECPWTIAEIRVYEAPGE